LLILLLSLGLLPAKAWAAELRIAVATNFADTLQRLAVTFSAQTGHRVVASSASTGKHYAQIRNGAAFDIFLAADAERPALLEQQGIGVPGSRFAYALGRLILWAPGEQAIDDPAGLLGAGRFRRLAVANPRLAPYGRAAQQVLEGWQLWQPLQPKIVRGENVGQAYQFVATGNAELGLVALSQLLAHPGGPRGAYRILPEGLHTPILQEALMLRRSEAAEAFLDYLKGEAAAALLREAGYGVPAAR